MKKVCIITASRSEYGLLRWVIDEVNNDEQLVLQLVVTGTHLSEEYGSTYIEIEKDGYKIDEKVDLSLSSSTLEGIVKSMGNCSIGFAETLNNLKPDVIIVLGDRYELLPICSAALVMNIPLAHISGGDVTLGAIDNQIRNAVTMMASFHFPGVKDSARRIEKMTGSSRNIYIVGEPGLDNFNRLILLERQILAENLLLDISKKWVLLNYHPETKLHLEENLTTIKNIIQALDSLNDIQVIITGANSDYGGNQINESLKNIALKPDSKYKFFMSLGQMRFLSLMKEVKFIIGNSSSGIVEAPFLSKIVINVGERQKGRYISPNVINTTNDFHSISNAIINAMDLKARKDNYYGDGHSSVKIKNAIKKILFSD